MIVTRAVVSPTRRAQESHLWALVRFKETCLLTSDLSDQCRAELPSQLQRRHHIVLHRLYLRRTSRPASMQTSVSLPLLMAMLERHRNIQKNHLFSEVSYNKSQDHFRHICMLRPGSIVAPLVDSHIQYLKCIIFLLFEALPKQGARSQYEVRPSKVFIVYSGYRYSHEQLIFNQIQSNFMDGYRSICVNNI
jgi:hypothetical protein